MAAQAHAPAPTAGASPEPFAVGSYLTNGGSLIGIVGALPQEPSLRLVEDCRTLEITVVSVQDLRDAGVWRIQSSA